MIYNVTSCFYVIIGAGILSYTSYPKQVSLPHMQATYYIRLSYINIFILRECEINVYLTFKRHFFFID